MCYSKMTMKEHSKVAIITGANAGVGFGIIQRLLQEDKHISIVMACRNHTRASNARKSLLAEFPEANIDIKLVDVGSTISVFDFCKAVKDSYSHIDYIFCNAGILSTSGINWSQVVWQFLASPVGFMERSDATVQIVGEINADGMGNVFAANVFGHYIMARELESLLHISGEGRVIWTSSLTAEKSVFDIEDWQGIRSLMPYESSKWACDLVAIGSNTRYDNEKQNITSFSTSPGVVASSIGNLPIWITKLRTLIHYAFRFAGVTSQNITGYRGAVAHAFVALQPLKTLNYLCRYTSLTSWRGVSYAEAEPISDYDPMDAEKLIQHCELAYQAWKNKYTQSRIG
ncbi:hypothetical protein BDB00DRAFT_833093 [Zychaea mexicana]|uniref:uncharacterized protein n=1 Tax=Zychaea mexicana TaxID=64656 RepID=UPI0022FE1288|nr:uncharacterized protein BDB00DRAFT_833093 [Zychaea mexicana]KAI9491457.1 hypothetical protein BDB00DRAFT_833093 [Zychaea mexicana]